MQSTLIAKGDGPDAALEHLMAESCLSVQMRERTTFDQLVYPHGKSLVLVGAGYMGSKALRALRSSGLEPIAFADDCPALQGQRLDDVPVVSIEEAAIRFGGSAAFVVTLLRPEVPFAETRSRLTALGCGKVVSAIPLFWKYPDLTLPHAYVDLPSRLLAQAEDVRAAYRLLCDEESRRLFCAQIAYRMHLDFDAIPPERDVSQQYFPTDLFTLRTDEYFVDCGAFDGDTVKSFLSHAGDGFDHLIALEPDPINYLSLKKYVASLAPALRRKIDLQPLAVGSRDAILRFNARGTNGSSLSDAGMTEVVSCRLDALLEDKRPTYIKMDIEGAELDALAGVENICIQTLPIFAVCVYHLPDHLWRIPLQLQALSQNYRLFLRCYMKEGMELVCYAISDGRLR